MSRDVPLVGVTTYVTDARWGPWRRSASIVPSTYDELVAEAGACPVLLPAVGGHVRARREDAAEVVRVLDALVLIGGEDVDPGAYGQPAHPEVSVTDAQRDEWERALLGAALGTGCPVLAICRGMQILNVHLGGTLLQHLPDIVGHSGHRSAPGAFDDVEVRTVPGTRVAEAMGEKDVVRCSHHQAVDRLGAGLVVAARSVEQPAGPSGSGEGVVEAVEVPGPQFVVGVQWHPEEASDRRLFDALVGAVRR